MYLGVGASMSTSQRMSHVHCTCALVLCVAADAASPAQKKRKRRKTVIIRLPPPSHPAPHWNLRIQQAASTSLATHLEQGREGYVCPSTSRWGVGGVGEWEQERGNLNGCVLHLAEPLQVQDTEATTSQKEKKNDEPPLSIRWSRSASDWVSCQI